jgi:hypothetical protein
MDNPSTPNTETEQVLHTGQLEGDLRETPVREFDNTTLNQAVEKDLLVTPSSAAELIEAGSEKKSKKKLIITLGSAAAGLALIGAGVFGITAANQPPKNQPVATASGDPTPEATSSTPETELSVASLEIPSSVAPEKAASMVEQDFAQWQMAGAKDATYKDNLNYDGTTIDFAREIAAKNTPIFSEALFVPTWQSDSQLAGRVQGEQANNAARLESWLMTYKSGDPADKEVYKYWSTVDSTDVTASTPTSASVDVTTTEHNNSAKNRISQYTPDELTQNGNRYVAHIDLVVVDGKWKIQKYEAAAAPAD